MPTHQMYRIRVYGYRAPKCGYRSTNMRASGALDAAKTVLKFDLWDDNATSLFPDDTFDHILKVNHHPPTGDRSSFRITVKLTSGESRNYEIDVCPLPNSADPLKADSP